MVEQILEFQPRRIGRQVPRQLPVGAAEQPDLEARVTALETHVRELAERVRHSEQDAAAARVLAGGADRDVAEIRGEIREIREQNTRVLNAMRDDLTDFRQRVETGFTRVDNGFTEIRGKLDGAAAGQQQIVNLLTTLSGQVSVSHTEPTNFRAWE